MKRVVFLALGLGFSSVAFASFDLMLVMDNQNRIHRVDPTTGAYLGNFQVGLPYVTSMAVSLVTKRVYLRELGEQVWVYNYNSGQLETIFRAGYHQAGLAVSPDGQTLYAGDLTLRQIYRHSAITGEQLGILGSVETEESTSLTTDQAGRVYAWNGSTVYSFAPSGGVINTVTVPISAWTTRQMAFCPGGPSPSTLIQVNGRNSFGWLGVSAAGMLGYSNTTTYSDFSSVEGTLSGHLGAYVLGKDATTAGLRITKLDPHPYYPGASFVMPQITSHRASAIVLAPEPGTWAALGLGALTLLRRRKK